MSKKTLVKVNEVIKRKQEFPIRDKSDQIFC